MVRFRLIPKDTKFYDLFAADGENLLAAARELEDMLLTYDRLDQRVARIRELEHAGDVIDQALEERLESAFVTPFDREDMHALISALYDVLDGIEETADTFILYKIDAPSAAAVELATLIVRQCEQIHEALVHLRGFKGLDQYRIEIHRLENEGDRIGRQAIADLFEGGDPINNIKWRIDYNVLEETIDLGEDVADIIERITLKNS